MPSTTITVRLVIVPFEVMDLSLVLSNNLFVSVFAVMKKTPFKNSINQQKHKTFDDQLEHHTPLLSISLFLLRHTMHEDKKRTYHIGTLGSIALHNQYTSTLDIIKIPLEVMDLSLVLGKNTLGYLLSQGPSFRSSNSIRCLVHCHKIGSRK